ncbi:MAG: hypothetical protein KAX39_05845 [candidate division Zixibacteria bacterium]|nr:hypothetical protein [candidate division Zixibacteria bacterium]
MFFKTKKNRGEDLNQKVEKYRKWWQNQTQAFSFDRSNSSKKNKPNRKSFDSSFVYYEEG